MAELYFRYGAMNSGKSTALIQMAASYEERGHRVLIVKPAIDTRSPAVLSRIGVDRVVGLVARPDVPVRERVLAGRVPRVGCVLVDEAQFLTPGQVDDLFEELKTICRCVRKAILNARTVDGRFTLSGDQVAIEGDVGYESMCGSCLERVAAC